MRTEDYFCKQLVESPIQDTGRYLKNMQKQITLKYHSKKLWGATLDLREAFHCFQDVCTCYLYVVLGDKMF